VQDWGFPGLNTFGGNHPISTLRIFVAFRCIIASVCPPRAPKSAANSTAVLFLKTFFCFNLIKNFSCSSLQQTGSRVWGVRPAFLSGSLQGYFFPPLCSSLQRKNFLFRFRLRLRRQLAFVRNRRGLSMVAQGLNSPPLPPALFFPPPFMLEVVIALLFACIVHGAVDSSGSWSDFGPELGTLRYHISLPHRAGSLFHKCQEPSSTPLPLGLVRNSSFSISSIVAVYPVRFSITLTGYQIDPS